MKLSIMILACFISLAVIAQNGGVVNITVNGNRNKEVRVDGKTYLVSTNASSTISTNAPIEISNLAPGQHSIELVRTNRYNTTRLGNTTTFNLRQGYDLDITVNNDGSVQLSEKRVRSNTGYGSQNRYRGPMSDENFNALLREVRNMRGTNARITAIASAFNNTSNYFTTAQASNLIGLVNSESGRLNLAKLSYRTITDPADFSQINELFNEETSTAELEEYVKNYNNNNPVNTGRGNRENQGYRKIAMTNANFTNLYNDISRQFGFGAKMSSLTDEFNNPGNYFTVAQARQLIQLVSDENNRLQLAKSSYDNIVDPENFTQLYDLFNSQSKRTELSDYVRSYSNR